MPITRHQSVSIIGGTRESVEEEQLHACRRVRRDQRMAQHTRPRGIALATAQPPAVQPQRLARQPGIPHPQRRALC